MYCQNLLELALVLAEHDPTYEDLATKFFEHFALIASALNDRACGTRRTASTTTCCTPTTATSCRCRRARSSGCSRWSRSRRSARRRWRGCPTSWRASSGSCSNRPEARDGRAAHRRRPMHAGWRMLSIVDEERLRRMLGRDARPGRVPLRPRPPRALASATRRTRSARRRRRRRTTLDYEPAESTTGLFGGNSNWRGPVWFPINYLLIEALRVYYRYLGDAFTVEYPTGSGNELDPRARSPTSSPRA